MVFQLCEKQTMEKVEWNFHKYLVDEKGRAVKSYGHRVQPIDIEEDIVSWVLDGGDGNVDKLQAAKHFRIAAKKGHSQKLTSQGCTTAERDIVQGTELLQIAADAGGALALKSLQEMKQDESKWIRKVQTTIKYQ
eukprot:scaffold12950_cov169-Skeletonema_marinoi.AAC.8